MSTIVPPQLPQAPTTLPTTTLPLVNVAKPPTALLQLALQTRVDAQVLNQLGQGAVQIKTPIGTFAINTPMTLQPGTNLSLVVQALQPQVKLAVVTIDGKPPNAAGRTTVAGQPSSTPNTGAAKAMPQGGPNIGQSSVTLTVGSKTIASVLRPPQGVIGMQAPQGQVGPVGNAVQGSTPPLAGSASAPSPQAPSYPTPGTTVPVRIAMVQPPVGTSLPTAPAATPLILSAGQTLSGVVSGTAQNGSPVIQTPIGDLTLPPQHQLPTGTRVGFDVLSTPKPPAGEGIAQNTSSPQTLFRSHGWPALEEAVKALAETTTSPAQLAATQSLQSIIPKLDGQLAANIMMFITALRGGDVKGWTGDNTLKVLEKVSPATAKRLREDFPNMRQVSDGPTSGDWRAMVIPFQVGAEIDPIRLYLRKNQDEDENGDPIDETRFVVDVNLTSIGRLQLDGLVRKTERQMDMIVRTDSPLAVQMRAGIQSVFANATDVTGIRGGLTFQATPPNFVDVQLPRDQNSAISSGAGVIA